MNDPRLAELEPRFRGDVFAVLEELERKGWEPRIASGLRTAEAQAEKVRRGTSQTLHSAHRAGRAADIIDRRYGWGGPASQRDFPFWVDLGIAARARNLTWGGDWQQFTDVAHIQDDRPIADTVASPRDSRVEPGDAAFAELPAWFSLGGGCSVAYQLRRRHLRLQPTPFDWIRTPFSAVLTLLADGFSSFLTDEQLRLHEGPPRVLRDDRLGIVFPHDSERYASGGILALRQHFAPGIAAMHRTFVTRSHVVLVRRGLEHTDALALRAVLARRYPHLDVTLVGIHEDAARMQSVDRRGDYLRVVICGHAARWQGDDAAWDWALDSVMTALVRNKLPMTVPRLLLGRDWLQVQSSLAYIITRRKRLLDEIPTVLHEALVAGEDHRFYRHSGIDFVATTRAIFGLVTGRRRGGGSTIEQQLYRTITDHRERTVVRKLRELLGARLVSRRYDKRTIAASYLVAAYFGASMNGLEQAVRTLSLPLSALSAEQAAALVARLKYPEPRAPVPRRREQIRQRTLWILSRMERGRSR